MRTPTRMGRKPRPGARFPSQILGDNVRAIRTLHKLSQRMLLERMDALGIHWAQATLSELERGYKPTTVDELFALAVALETTVVKLLDPGGVAGIGGSEIDLSGGNADPR